MPTVLFTLKVAAPTEVQIEAFSALETPAKNRRAAAVAPHAQPSVGREHYGKINVSISTNNTKAHLVPNGNNL